MTQGTDDLPERQAGKGTDLWRLITAPIIWSVHFLVSYVGTAIYCAKWGRAADLEPARWLVLGATALALAGIGWVFWSLWNVRGVSVEGQEHVYGGNSPEERHRFLSHVALMLCVLSMVGVLYVTLPVLTLGSCR
jgi:hypothetical protein